MGSYSDQLGVGGGGGAIKLRTPPDVFTGANRTAAILARNNGLNAAALAEFNEDPNLAIILRVGATDTYQVRRSNAWRDVTNVVRGQQGEPGPGPTDQQLSAAVSKDVKPYAIVGGPDVPEDEISSDIARVAQIPTAAKIKSEYESNPDTNALTDDLLKQLQSVADPKRLVGLLQWDVSPSILDGVTAADFERTFRLAFEAPYTPLTDFYFEVFVFNQNQAGTLVHARRQWSQVTHLDVAISATDAGTIAGSAAATDDHIEFELRFFSDSTSTAVQAVTSRRVLIVEASSSGMPSEDARDDVARAAAKAAADKANAANENANLALTTAGNNVTFITDLERRADARDAIAGRVEVNPGRIAAAADLDGTYQCIVTLTDAEVTRLTAAGVNYLEIWFGTETVHVVSPWAPANATRVDAVVDTTEETAIGSVGNVVPVRAVYRINQGGSQNFYGEGAGALRIGGYALDVSAAIDSALPPFADIRLLPEAVPGSQVPDDFYLELAGKLTSREIDGITLLIQGVTIQPHASTPVSGFDTETQAFVRFDVSSVADAIANGLSASDRTAIVDLTFSFTEGDDFTRRILLPVNNPNAPRLVQGELDDITFNAALTLDWLAPDMRSVTLTADITFSFSNIQVGRPLVLEVKQGGAGGHSITWPSSVEWAGGSAEGPSSGAGDVDIFTLLPLSSTRILAVALLDVS